MTDDTRTEEEGLAPSSPEEEPSDALAPSDTSDVSDESDTSAEPAASPSAELRLIRAGQETGDSFPISGRAVIGRFDPTVGPIDVDLSAIPEAVYISRKHAVIEFADGAWTITDLGSSNGTFVLVPGEDFARIEGPTALEDGTQISLGNARFVFHLVVVKETEDQPPPGEAEA